MTNVEQITQTLELETSPEMVYNTLVKSELHSELTGAPAEFDNKIGGEFSTFNGAITGIITELKPNKSIKLKWRANGFPEDYFTDVEFKLEKTEKGTEINFTHNGVPKEAIEMISEGWETNYWSKLKEKFES